MVRKNRKVILLTGMFMILQSFYLGDSTEIGSNNEKEEEKAQMAIMLPSTFEQLMNNPAYKASINF